MQARCCADQPTLLPAPPGVLQMDSSGVSRSIECDDHEALLVGSWIRTSAWLQPHLQDRFHIELEQEVQEVTQVR